MISFPIMHSSLLVPEGTSNSLAATSNDMTGASGDAEFVQMWLQRKESKHTRRAYASDAARFFTFVRKPLAAVRLGDVQDFIASLGGSLSSQARIVGSIKSLLGFGYKTGYLRFDVGRVIEAPKLPNRLAERILDEAKVHRMLALTPEGRDGAILRLLYTSGMRISELCFLRWRDLQERDDAGQVTVFGKGGKSRTILLTQPTWSMVVALRGDASLDGPVFTSRSGKALDQTAVHRIVRKAAKAAGISANVSAHWLRHSHASHAIDRGAPISLVQVTLGHASVATTGKYLHARPNDSSARFVAA
jgi:site-specific recombinase XerD